MDEKNETPTNRTSVGGAATIIHVVLEIIVMAFLFVYFQRKTSMLQKKYSTLQNTIKKLEAVVKKHDVLLSKMFGTPPSNIDFVETDNQTVVDSDSDDESVSVKRTNEQEQGGGGGLPLNNILSNIMGMMSPLMSVGVHAFPTQEPQAQTGFASKPSDDLDDSVNVEEIHNEIKDELAELRKEELKTHTGSVSTPETTEVTDLQDSQ